MFTCSPHLRYSAAAATITTSAGSMPDAEDKLIDMQLESTSAIPCMQTCHASSSYA